jgi:hypothetical protein
MTKALFIAGMLLIAAIRVFSSGAAKGWFTEKWQLWMLGGPRHGKASKAEEIVM